MEVLVAIYIDNFVFGDRMMTSEMMMVAYVMIVLCAEIAGYFAIVTHCKALTELYVIVDFVEVTECMDISDSVHSAMPLIIGAIFGIFFN